MPHTACRRNKWVRVKLHNGNIIIDQFLDRRSKWIVLKRVGKVMKKDIDSFGMMKAPSGDEEPGDDT
jgi:hypothetical protein